MIRAAEALRDETGCALGVSIAIDKRIPMGAGMGGGSSDAASVLLGLNRLWRLGLSRAALMRIGLSLGADVPFFVFGRHARMSGIGEVLEAVSLPRVAFVIAVPPVHSATRDVFASSDLARDTPVTGRASFALSHGRNDLQPVAASRQRAIGTALRALDAVAFEDAERLALSSARMTGSGSAVFRIVDRAFPASAEAWRAAGTDERDGWKLLQRIHYRLPRTHDASGRPVDAARLVHARAIARHPLHDFAAK
jgi:4-diphosphocytidyl-2-C-methyl-D-erythritol kinase